MTDKDAALLHATDAVAQGEYINRASLLYGVAALDLSAAIRARGGLRVLREEYENGDPGGLLQRLYVDAAAASARDAEAERAYAAAADERRALEAAEIAARIARDAAAQQAILDAWVAERDARRPDIGLAIKVKAMSDEGWCDAYMADQIGVSRQSIWNARKRLGLAPGTRGLAPRAPRAPRAAASYDSRRVAGEKQRRAAELVDGGATYSLAAALTGLTRNGVAGAYRRARLRGEGGDDNDRNSVD